MEIPEKHPLRDFRNFLYIVWTFLWQTGAINAAKPDPTPVQYDIAHFLQHGPRRKIIKAFRGVGKSWITAAYVCWRLLLNPNLNFLVVSASKDRSDQFSTFTKRLINELPILASLKPKPGQRDSNIAFDVGPAGISHSPSVKSVGITGQMTGSRADEIIADDIESLNNSLTQKGRDDLEIRRSEFDAIIKPNGVITALGTPQTEMSIYESLPERGYVPRVWPARVPGDLEKYKGHLAPMILDMVERGASPGALTDPQRFTEQDLTEREASYGKSGFALQFMLDTELSNWELYPLRLEDLIVSHVDPETGPVRISWSAQPSLRMSEVPTHGLAKDFFYRAAWESSERVPYVGSVMYIDPSGRGKDETAYAVVKNLNGWLYVTDAGGFTGGYTPEVLQGLADAAKAGKVTNLVVESNMGDGMFLELLKPYLAKTWPVATEEDRATGQKERRIIDTLEPVLNQHKLVVSEKLIRKDHETASKRTYSLFYQMTRVTKERGSLAHDDRLDALHGAVRFWTDRMARDGELEEQKHKEEMLLKELEDFMSDVHGGSVRPPDQSFLTH